MYIHLNGPGWKFDKPGKTFSSFEKALDAAVLYLRAQTDSKPMKNSAEK